MSASVAAVPPTDLSEQFVARGARALGPLSLCLLGAAMACGASLAIYLPALSGAVASGTILGAATATQATGIVAGGLCAAALARRLSTQAGLVMACLGCCGALAALATLDSAVVVFAARFLLGASIALAAAQLEFLIMVRGTPESRTVRLAFLGTAMTAGAATAPMLATGLGGRQGAYLLVAGAVALSTLLVLASGVRGARNSPEGSSGQVRTRLSFRIVSAAILFGSIQTGFFGLLASYSQARGLASDAAALACTAALSGALLLQVPAAFMLAKTGVTMCSTILAAMAILAFSLDMSGGSVALLCVKLVILGALCEVLYVTTLAEAVKGQTGQQQLRTTGHVVALCGSGEIVGPLVGGLSIDAFGALSLPHVFAIALAVCAVTTLLLHHKRQKLAYQ